MGAKSSRASAATLCGPANCKIHGVMNLPGFTKQALRNSFMKLLNERPVSQITVKDIGEDCGINRNSFYYHYQALPSLVE
ncbi:TetR/AcrR family transcriptional regulator [Parablautia intestinalis]|uniref:TetR/AcrR family transcriptional regulator n=1 Tax=Parablautia intestinalis TaxID=2320100 RepID=UPI00256ED07D|nr:TetR/AcrR family transcriptional regulator [Parablautia intestinalis]